MKPEPIKQLLITPDIKKFFYIADCRCGCGSSTGELCIHSEGGMYHIFCRDCQDGPDYSYTLNEAIEDWMNWVSVDKEDETLKAF